VDYSRLGKCMIESARVKCSDVARGDVSAWFADRQRAHSFHLRQIPFSECVKWVFDAETGNLRHESGRFFSIEGIHVKTNWGKVAEWEQPIIYQPEIGILGFIVREINHVLQFLVQAKMEPGNINMIQLAPTLQATKSNFTRVHQGKSPPYLEWFLERRGVQVWVDVLQSEQGARFLRKRNRNMIVFTEKEVPAHEDYRWMTLGELHEALSRDNLVNMDARTVLSCLPVDVHDDMTSPTDGLQSEVLHSMDTSVDSRHTNEEIISWFTEMKFRYELTVERMPLKRVRGWMRTEGEVTHEEGKYFSVIACSVQADNREIPCWSQPLVMPRQRGLIAFVVKSFAGVLHFLVQAKVEPGNFDVVEMAPTVQCLTGSYQAAHPDDRPPFVDYVTGADAGHILFDTLQSEEGGRFYREENRNMVVTVDANFPACIPDNFIWMTARQLREFIKYNNFVNVQARCLLSCLGFS
jgi:oxidase EvaA